MKIVQFYFTALFILITALPLMGTTILIREPEVVVKEAPLIIDAIVKDVKFNRVSNLSRGEALITLKVIYRIIGDCPAEIVIRRWNVTPELKFYDTEWDPSFILGERFIICLLPTKDGYSRMGLYNGKFIIEDNIVKGTKIQTDEFKKQIKEIREGIKERFPDELPRQTVNSVNYNLHKLKKENSTESSGCFLNGEFMTYNFTWNPSYLPVQFHYNPANAPDGTPDAGTIANLAAISYSVWNDQYSFLTFQNASPYSTNNYLTKDTYNVIVWYDPHNVENLAYTDVYPNGYNENENLGPNTNTGVDIWFNSNLSPGDHWYFNTVAPSTHTMTQIDFVDVLAHELGHVIGMKDIYDTTKSYLMMFSTYEKQTGTIRGLSDGDKAGNVYQHTVSNMNLSGTLPHSLVLSALPSLTVNITDNVSIPSGKTFEIGNSQFSEMNTITISPGKWIKPAAGGYFKDNSGNTWNPNLKRTSGTTLLGHYYALETAVSDAGSGQAVDAVTGSYSLSSNISIPSGVTLTIHSGVTVNLNGHSIIPSSGGTLTVQNGANIIGGVWQKNSSDNILALHSTVQSALSAAADSQKIYITSGTYNENVSVSNKSSLRIEGVYNQQCYINGTISFYSCSNLNLSSFECKNLTISNSPDAIVYNEVYGTGSSGNNGIQLYSSARFQRRGTIGNTNIGLLADASNGAIYPNASFSGNYISIKASSSSNLGINTSHICGSIYKDLYAETSGYMDAVNCYYNGGVARYTAILGGIVRVFGQAACMPKTNITANDKTNTSEVPQIQGSDDPVENKFISINNSHDELIKEIRDEIREKGYFDKAKFFGEFTGIIDSFKNFINKNPDQPLSKTALTTAALSFSRFEDNEGLKQFLNEIIKNNEKGKLKSIAERFLIEYYRNNKDFSSAVDVSDALIRKYPTDTLLICEALYSKGLILLYDLNLTQKAEECFKTIVKNYPGEDMAAFAETQLGILGYANEMDNGKVSSIDKTQFIVSNNPNPFNPSTIIKYALPQNSRVTLEVYSILGEKVASLVNEVKSSGYHEAVFDGSNLSSGIYIYRLTASSLETGKQFVKSAKMILVK